MSIAVEINGTPFLSIREAAKRVGYSPDYVSRLARESKIVASQLGRQWYVDIDSLLKYHSHAKLVEELQKNSLRTQRKRELEAAARLKTVETEVRFLVETERQPAMLSTLAVLLVGLITGGMIYSFGTFYVPASFPFSANVAVVTPALTNSKETMPTIVEPLPTLLYTTEDRVLERESIIPLKDASGILLLARSRPADTPAAIAELFSDPVKVEFLGEEGGVVRYKRPNGEMVEFPFVRIPAASPSPSLNE